MSIIKSKQAGNFTVLSNDIFKSDLSIEAIGLLAYFLSLPHDWVIYKTKLHDQLNMGREKLDRIFKELQESGYILSVKRQQESGRFEHEHIVYDKPYNGEPASGEPDTGLPPMANQPLLKKQLTKETIQKKENKKKIDFVSSLVALGVREQVASDWVHVRKTKGASDTETAFALFLSEVQKSGLTVEQCVLTCIEHSWKGFKSSWLDKQKKIVGNLTPNSSQFNDLTW